MRITQDPDAALREADVVLICVGTPSDAAGRADLQFVEQVVDTIGAHVQGAPVVALRSTVPVGTTERVEARLNAALAKRGKGPSAVLANPEFLRTGRAIDDFLRPTRVVLGLTRHGLPTHLEVLSTLYAPLNAPVLVMDAGSAELVKNASNAFLAMRVSFVNEIAALCDQTGGSVDDVVAAMALDPRIGGQFMQPGLGYGGSCLPKDVRSLIAVGSDHGVEMRLARAVDETNRGQVSSVVEMLKTSLGRPIDGSRIGVLGLAFKPDTDDIRESPAVALVQALQQEGAVVVACDPEASSKVAATNTELILEDDPVSAARDADAVVLATEWPVYVTADLAAIAAAMRGELLLDTRNALDPSKVAAAGLRYRGVGRSGAARDSHPQEGVPASR